MQHAYREDIEYYEDRADGLLASARDGTEGAVAAFARYDAPLTRDGARTVVAREHGGRVAGARRHVAGLRDFAASRSRAPTGRSRRTTSTGWRRWSTSSPTSSRARGTNGNDLLGMAGATCDERLVASCSSAAPTSRAATRTAGRRCIRPPTATCRCWRGCCSTRARAWTRRPRRRRHAADRGAVLGQPRDRRAARRARRAPAQPARRRRPRPARARRALGTDEPGAHRGFYRPHSGFPAWRPSDDPQEVLDEALAWAARSDRADTLAELVARGAAVDADVYRGTALAWAAACGRVAAIRARSSHSAPTRPARHVRRPGARRRASPRCTSRRRTATWPAIRALLELGADPTIRDGLYGGTPADWAAHSGHNALAHSRPRIALSPDGSSSGPGGRADRAPGRAAGRAVVRVPARARAITAMRSQRHDAVGSTTRRRTERRRRGRRAPATSGPRPATAASSRIAVDPPKQTDHRREGM